MKNKLLLVYCYFVSFSSFGQVLINALPDTNVPDSTWLMVVGNPSTGEAYKITIDKLKDSVFLSGGGSQTLDQVLTTGNIANLLYTDENYKYTNWVVPTSTPLNSNFILNIKKITPSEYGTDTTVGLWSETISENQSGQEGSPTARKNVSWSWGYNTDQGIANEGYLKFSIESNLRSGGAEWFEWHAPEVMTRDGAINRWYSVTGSKASPQATHTFRGNTLQFLDITDPSIQLFGFDGSNWGIKGDYIRFTNKTAGRSSMLIQTNSVDLNMVYGVGTAGKVYENYGTATRYITSQRNNFTSEVYTDKYFAINTVASAIIFGATNGGGYQYYMAANGSNTGVNIEYFGSSITYSLDNSTTPIFKLLADVSRSYSSLFQVYSNGIVSIGTASPSASSILDITSTTKGFLPPRMTKTQRDAISSPATGLVVYQTDNTPGLRCYNGTNWMRYTETAD